MTLSTKQKTHLRKQSKVPSGYRTSAIDNARILFVMHLPLVHRHILNDRPHRFWADTQREQVDIVHFLRDRISDRVPPALQEHPQASTATDESPRQDREMSSSPKHHRGPLFSTSRDSTSNSALVQEKPQQTSSFEAPKHHTT
jgi:hypothetical protein